MNLPEFTWIYLNLPEVILIYLNLHELSEFTWIYLNFSEFFWIYLNLPEPTWIYLNLLELTWTYQNYLNASEFTWIEEYEDTLEINEQTDKHMISPLHWDPIGSNNIIGEDLLPCLVLGHFYEFTTHIWWKNIKLFT